MKRSSFLKRLMAIPAAFFVGLKSLASRDHEWPYETADEWEWPEDLDPENVWWIDASDRENAVMTLAELPWDPEALFHVEMEYSARDILPDDGWIPPEKIVRDGRSQETAFRTLEEAIKAASTGGQVRISPHATGRITEIDASAKSITVSWDG